jgi:glyoxalase family protein
MPAAPSGIHHVTGIVGDAQTAVDFYAGTLGLRFAKQTVNFEDVLQHHPYFGDTAGNPGTVFTAFADPHGVDGRVGKPQVETVTFAVPDGSLSYWRDRLDEAGVAVEGPEERFDERVLRVRDPAGTRVELATDGRANAAASDPWTEGVPERAAIRGIAGVSLLSVNPFATAVALETLGFEYGRESDERVRVTTRRYPDLGHAVTDDEFDALRSMLDDARAGTGTD